MKHKVFGVTGWKNNGKTTLIVSLIKQLNERGYKIATIKHVHHDFDIDHENTDSWRHRKAGAFETAIVSDKRFALIHELGDESEPSLNDILKTISPCDLVLVEGFKNSPHDKIEVRRAGGKLGPALSENDNHIVAIASNMHINETTLPVFELDNIDKIADFIETHMQLNKR